MGDLRKLLTALIMVLIIGSCQTNDNKATITEVAYTGALRTIMAGNIQATISLDSLSNRKHLYALGAVENLKGEVQIFNSEPSNSFVVNGNLRIKDAYKVNAALLVYAEVQEWREFKLENIATKDELENIIFETAKTNGINMDEPFPFLLNGQVASLNWHVINWKEGDTIHSHEKHKTSGLNGVLNQTDVLVLGFYSTKHKAVFTHHTTNMHMHVKTADNTIAGHIDDIVVGEQIMLKLPKQ